MMSEESARSLTYPVYCTSRYFILNSLHYFLIVSFNLAPGTTAAARVPLASPEHSVRPPIRAWTTRASMATALSLAIVSIHAV